MSRRGNSGFIDRDKRFGDNTPSGDTKGIVEVQQHYLERTKGRFVPLEDGVAIGGTPTVWYNFDTANVTLTGSRVSSVDDLSGNGINAAESGSAGPLHSASNTAFNNEGTAQFQTNDDMESSDSALLDSTNGFTVYVVARIDSFASTFSQMIQRSNGTSWTQGWGMLYYAGTWRMWVNNWNSAATRVELGAWSDFTNAHIFKLHYDRVNVTAEIIGPSGLAEGNTAYTVAVSNPATDGIYLGEGGSNTYDINCTMGEMVFYNSPLSSDNQTATENYLKAKYNIS